MPLRVKLNGSEIALSSANTLASATLVRVYNNAGQEVLLTRKDSGGTTLGTCTLANNFVEYFIKSPTDTLEANAAVRACSVAQT